ncbi:MAG TPA: hypothetical protein VIL37_18760 [Natronosporangium sp.]
MRRRLVGRLLAGGGFALLAAAVTAGPGSAFALADNELSQVTITGDSLPEELTIQADEQPELCAALWREVNWLVNRRSDTREPEDLATLGEQYTLEVYLDGEARHRFHLYPMAEGGPKAFRPAEQPGDRTVREGWFHARLSLPETLTSAGVPLAGTPLPPGGGGGGGGPVPEPTEEAPTEAFGFLDEWRRGMLLTGAVVVTIVAGLGGIAFLIRRKV